MLLMCLPDGGFASPLRLVVRESGIHKGVLFGARYLGIAIDVRCADVEETMKSRCVLRRGQQVLCTDDIGFEIGLARRPISRAGCAMEDVRDLLNALSQGRMIGQISANNANRGRGEMAQV